MGISLTRNQSRTSLWRCDTCDGNKNVSARFITENNAFQRDEEKFGRHQTVNKMIKNYQMRKQ